MLFSPFPMVHASLEWVQEHRKWISFALSVLVEWSVDCIDGSNSF
jgi:hypothetical protein